VDQNRVVLVGRLTRDPEFQVPGSRGTAHCNFTLAVNRVVANRDGPKADYIPCSLWGKAAQEFAEVCSKGDEVGVIGRLRANYVQQPGGDSRCFFEIRVDEINLGAVARKNLQAKPKRTTTTAAIDTLREEFTP
jgi:single-strand DNA-binding protein